MSVYVEMTTSRCFVNLINHLRSEENKKELGGVFTFSFLNKKSSIAIKDFIQIPNESEKGNKYKTNESLYRELIHSFPEDALFGDWHTHLSNIFDPSTEDDITMFAKADAVNGKVYSMIITAINIALYEYTPKKKKMILLW